MSANFMSRSASSIGRPKTCSSMQGLCVPPTVSHPNTSCCDPSQINIRGSSAVGKSCEEFLTYRDISKDTYKYITPKCVTETIHFPIKPRTKEDEKRMNLDEIDMAIREKMKRERYAVQCLFKNSDVNGRGYITKGALLKILYSMCGKVTFDHFNKLLERYGLDERTVITFQDFEKSFGGPPAGRFHVPISMVAGGVGKYISVAFATQLLKQFAREPEFNLKAILPPSCFENDGLILMPQWREAMERININMTDQDFVKFWIRFDIQGCGSIPTQQMCKILNLDNNGLPKPVEPRVKTAVRIKSDKLQKDKKASRSPTPRLDNALASSKAKSAGSAGSTPHPTSRSGLSGDGKNPPVCSPKNEVPKYTNRLNILKSHRPKYNSIVDCLLFQMEEPYQAMLVNFEHLDNTGEGRVTISQLSQILLGYGFKISDQNLQKFLNMVNVKRYPRDRINYKELLDKFQIRGDFTYSNRIIKKLRKSLKEEQGIVVTDMLTPEELEMKLANLLHADYIKFISTLQAKDSEGKRHLPIEVMRQTIDSVLGYSMRDEQFVELQSHFSTNSQGLVNYDEFLARFNAPSNICKRKATIPDSDLTKTGTPPVKPKPPKRRLDIPPRTFYQLCCQVEDVLKIHFHKVDKFYKQMGGPRKDILKKEQFGEILERHGLPVSDEELDKLWDSLGPFSEKWTYRQMMRHFMSNIRVIAMRMEERERYEKLADVKEPALDRLKEFRKARRAQKQALLERMENHLAKVEAVIPRQADPDYVKQVVNKIRPVITAHWEAVKDYLRDCDIIGYSTVEVKQMKEMARQFRFGLTEEELDKLCIGYDYKKNGRFHYIDFLKNYASVPQTSEQSRFDILTHKLRDQKTKKELTISTVLDMMRKQMLSEHKTLLRGFRKLDVNRNGLLDIKDFKNILTRAGVKLDDDDLYHLLTEFDVNMDGKIDYHEFVQKCMNVY